MNERKKVRNWRNPVNEIEKRAKAMRRLSGVRNV